MNIEAFDLDKLRELVRDLQKENEDLKKLLSDNNIRYEKIDHFDMFNKRDNFDANQDERIVKSFITEKI